MIFCSQVNIFAPVLAEEAGRSDVAPAATPAATPATTPADDHRSDAAPPVPSAPANEVPAAAVERVPANSALSWLVMALAFFAAAGSSATALVVFRWRKAVGDGQISVLPNIVVRQAETLWRSQRDQRNELHEAMRYVVELAEQTKGQYEALTAANREINEILRIFQESLSEKDAEIRKLRQGGEREVFRQYLARLLRLARIVGEEIQDVAKSGGDIGPLQAVEQVLGDVLDDCGVEAFAPALGAALRESEGVAERPGSIETDDPERHLTIAEVVQPGFRFRTGESPIILQEAKVTVFVCGREEE